MGNMINRPTFCRLFACLTIVCLVGGCRCKGTRSFNTYVTLSESAKKDRAGFPAVEVDVIGLTELELEDWKSQSINDYFNPQGTLRASTEHVTFKLGNDKTTDVLPKDNETWAKWQARGVMHLMALVNWPRPVTEETGKRRRLVIPLDCSRWDKKQTDLRLVVTSEGLRLDTQPLPPKK